MVGLSFGALIALNLFLRRPEAKGFIMLSPAVLHYDFVSWLTPCLGIGLVVNGTNDPLLPIRTANSYIQCLKSKKMTVDSIQIQGTEHLFKDKEKETTDKILKFILNNKSPQQQVANLKSIDEEETLSNIQKRIQRFEETD